MAGHGDYIDASEVPVEELRAALFERSDRWSPALALSLLLTKDYPQKQRDLQRVLEAEGDNRLAVMAADGLGRLGTRESVQALARTVARSGPRARRAAARSLAGSGPPEAGRVLREVRGLASEEEADRHAAEWSAQLHALRFRQPLERPIIAPGITSVGVEEARAEPVAVEPLAEREASAVLDGLRRSSLRVDVTVRGARRLRCGRDTYAVVLAADVAEGQPERVLAAPGILAVVAHYDEVEAGDWEGRYLVVSQPSGEGTADLAVVGPDGRLTQVGRARSAGEDLAFDLRAVARPGAVAVDCAGEVGAGGVRFDRFLSEQRVRRGGETVAPIPLAEEDRG